MKKILLITGLAMGLSNLSAKAQQDSAQTKPEFKISVNYNSYLNYYGRTDSLQSSGFFPMAEFWVTPNFYVNAAPIFVNNKLQSFDYAGTVATAGFQNMSEKWLTGLYVMKPFYEESAELVQAALKAQAGASVTKLNKILNLTLGGDVKFTDATDFGAMAGADHIIRIENKDNSVLVFDPSFYAYAGTQRFSRAYVTKQNNPLPLPIGGGSEESTEDVNQFNILAYELSMPVIFAKGKMQVMAIPSYIIPQNLLTVKNRPDLSETGENRFYGTVSLKFTF